MKFVDEAKLFVRSGKGGDGCVSFLHEKYRPKGGPDGGDGGRGSSVFFRAAAGLSTLVEFQFKNQFRAKNGERGKGKNRHGKDAADLVIPVPVGTVIQDLDTGEVLCELLQVGQKFLAAKGGKGGRGNSHFAKPWEQAPRIAEPGEPSQERWLKVMLKLLADVGLVGFPNTGKSSLLARVSAARPKIADYPFSTLTPLLGVVRLGEGQSFVMADIPGLIEGAHRGAGLGTHFLRHIERASLLVHLLDLSDNPGRNPAEDYHKLSQELSLYNPKVIEKPQVVAGNKIDLKEAQAKVPGLKDYFQALGLPFFPISALTGEGVGGLLHYLGQELKERALTAMT